MDIENRIDHLRQVSSEWIWYWKVRLQNCICQIQTGASHSKFPVEFLPLPHPPNSLQMPSKWCKYYNGFVFLCFLPLYSYSPSSCISKILSPPHTLFLTSFAKRQLRLAYTWLLSWPPALWFEPERWPCLLLCMHRHNLAVVFSTSPSAACQFVHIFVSIFWLATICLLKGNLDSLTSVLNLFTNEKSQVLSQLCHELRTFRVFFSEV